MEAITLNGRINTSSVEAGRTVERTGANTINLWFCGRKLKDFLNDGFYFMKTEIKLFAKSDGQCDGIRGFRRAETILNPCREWERK